MPVQVETLSPMELLEESPWLHLGLRFSFIISWIVRSSEMALAISAVAPVTCEILSAAEETAAMRAAGVTRQQVGGAAGNWCTKGQKLVERIVTKAKVASFEVLTYILKENWLEGWKC